MYIKFLLLSPLLQVTTRCYVPTLVNQITPLLLSLRYFPVSWQDNYNWPLTPSLLHVTQFYYLLTITIFHYCLLNEHYHIL